MKTRVVGLATAILISFILWAPTVSAEPIPVVKVLASGSISGKIRGGVAKAGFPVPPSTVLAYGLYLPGYRGAAAIAPSGKFRISALPPGPYLLLFEVWAPNRRYVDYAPYYVWVQPGVPIPDEPDLAERVLVKVDSIQWRNQTGVPFLDRGYHVYDYRGVAIADLLSESTDEFSIVEEQGGPRYEAMLAAIQEQAGSSDAATPLDLDLATALLQAVGPDTVVLGQIVSQQASDKIAAATLGTQTPQVAAGPDPLASLIDPVTDPVRRGQTDPVRKTIKEVRKTIKKSAFLPLLKYYRGTYSSHDFEDQFGQGALTDVNPASFSGPFEVEYSGNVLFVRSRKTSWDSLRKLSFQVYDIDVLDYVWSFYAPNVLAHVGIPNCVWTALGQGGDVGSQYGQMLVERVRDLGPLGQLSFHYQITVSTRAQQVQAPMVCPPPYPSYTFLVGPRIRILSGPPGNPGNDSIGAGSGLSFITGTWRSGGWEWTWQLQGE